MVAAGGGFALVPQSMAAISPPDVTYHALTTPELYTDIALCWRRFERSRTVKRFWRCRHDDRGFVGQIRHRRHPVRSFWKQPRKPEIYLMYIRVIAFLPLLTVVKCLRCGTSAIGRRNPKYTK
jgi:hypothetical protein